MAVGWLGILKAVPWKDVVSNAPGIVDGAKNLWGSVAKKVRGENDRNLDPQPAEMTTATRLDTLETQLADLQKQLLTSSDLIRSLADQNARLVAQLEIQQTRLRWMIIGVGLALAGSGGCLWVVLKIT